MAASSIAIGAIEAARAFAEGQPQEDDVTVLVCKRNADSQDQID